MSSSTGRRVGIIIGVIVLLGLGVLAWAAIRPGPLAFAGDKTVALASYSGGHPTGVPADFTDTEQLAIVVLNAHVGRRNRHADRAVVLGEIERIDAGGR